MCEQIVKVEHFSSPTFPFLEIIDEAKLREKEAVLSEKLLREEMSNRCISVHPNPGQFNKDSIPHFSGQGETKLYIFQTNFIEIMQQKCIPVSCRAAYLIEALSGPAKKAILECSPDPFLTFKPFEIFRANQNKPCQ